MGGQQKYMMKNTKMISVGLLLALFVNGCFSEDKEPLNPFDVPALKVLFRCDGHLCPVGQDCLSVDGKPRCADPCLHHSVLNDSWRANDHQEDLSDPHCDDDVDWMGWYRMYVGGDVSLRMPERCQVIKSCGTHAPAFSVQPHPKVGDGIQQHTICATWENGCCKFNLNPIHVKTCPGNFVVYKFVNPHDCRVAYCADVKTKVCLTCKEDENCVSDDKINYSCEKREDKAVKEAPDSGDPINPFEVPAMKVLIRCDGRVCPQDQDCLSVDGKPRCADPCLHHSVLNDSWRANDHFEDLSDPHSDDDVDWMGWYRMFLGGDISYRMPERCQVIKSCGTHAPSFLVQPHPRVGDAVQRHTICATWENGCCKFHLEPIHVKACPGNFIVYKFVHPHDPRVAYCADVQTKVCATCGADEDCVSDDKISYRCEKREAVTAAVMEPAMPTMDLVCKADFMEFSIPLAALQAAGLDLSSVHLAKPGCKRGADRDGKMQASVPRVEGQCGNTLKMTDTHLVYSNALTMKFLAGGEPLKMEFSCSYPLSGLKTTLDVEVKPFLIGQSLAGFGPRPTATLALYRNDKFTESYPAGPVALPKDTPLYVGATIAEVEHQLFTTVMESCFLTHTANPEDKDANKVSFIEKKCPVDNTMVTAVENGVSLTSHFAAVTKVEGEVFLHCNVALCNKKKASCLPKCAARKSRSADSLLLELLTLGPITLN